jgi:pyrimidine operon attenuation protein / uracil phosphoribosyltransferase
MSEATTHKELILDADQVDQKIRRIAYSIYENNFAEKVIVLAGIDGQGYTLANLLAKELESISPLKTTVLKVSLDKLAPLQSEVRIDTDVKELKRKCVILIDDVLNTGRTLAYGLKPFLNADVKKIEIAVLVNRSHTAFPLLPTYTGYELSTTLTEHVEVILGKKSSVYLH